MANFSSDYSIEGSVLIEDPCHGSKVGLSFIQFPFQDRTDVENLEITPLEEMQCALLQGLIVAAGLYASCGNFGYTSQTVIQWNNRRWYVMETDDVDWDELIASFGQTNHYLGLVREGFFDSEWFSEF